MKSDLIVLFGVVFYNEFFNVLPFHKTKPFLLIGIFLGYRFL